jgi:hypothetical protein
VACRIIRTRKVGVKPRAEALGFGSAVRNGDVGGLSEVVE